MPLFHKSNAKRRVKKEGKNKKGFEAVPVLLKHLEHTKLISILGRVNVFSFVVEEMHKR